MKIIIVALLLIIVISYLVYKIRTNFTKKELISFFLISLAVIILTTYLGKEQKNKMPNAFKKFYLNQTNIEIKKISASQTNVTVLKSDTNIYKFNYIILKNNQEYFCEANNIEVIEIENEYIFKNFKETCSQNKAYK